MATTPRARNVGHAAPAEKCGRCLPVMLPPNRRLLLPSPDKGLMAWHIPCKFRAP